MAKSSGPMKFIDFHVHINPLQFLKPDVVRTFRAKQPQYQKILKYTKSPPLFLQLMDAEGVERACLINYVAPDVMGYPPQVNEWVYKYAAHDRARLVPFGGLHPGHVKSAKAEVEKLVYSYELGGIKVHGPHSLYFPNAYVEGDKTLRILYETCEREGVPVMFHTGTSVFPGARNKFGDPMAVDDVAVDFPKLKIVLAHGGRPLWMATATFLVRRHPNVYMDISSIPPAALLSYFPKLEELADKAIFGSDWPGPHVPGMRANAEAVAKLPLAAEAMTQILLQNARRILKRA